MKILVLTDLHGDYEKIEAIGKTIEESDLLILAGDITHFGQEKELKEVLSQLRSYNTNLLAVSGNCDYPEVEAALQSATISLHARCTEVSGYAFIGLSGSLPCPGSTPFEFQDQQFEVLLQHANSMRDVTLPLILVCHQPPYGTKNDRVILGLHAGSRAIRSFIEETQPLLCLCGHIHEGRGIDHIGSTAIINPGPWKNGHYAEVELEGTSVTINLL
jgi:uncharacterized protein